MPADKRMMMHFHNIHSELEQELKKSLGRLSGCWRALLFSGGFDSMLLAVLMRRYGADVTAVTVQFDHFNPVTVAEAVSLAQRMALKHHIVRVTLPEFLEAFKTLPSFTSRPFCDLDLILTHAAFMKYDTDVAGNVFISGMGSDQLFGSLESGLSGLDEEAQHETAALHGYQLIFPFLSEAMQKLSQNIPPAQKKDKKILHELVGREHKALIPVRSGRREIQVPDPVRRILVRIYGGRRRTLDGDVDAQIPEIVKRMWAGKKGGGVQH